MYWAFDNSLAADAEGVLRRRIPDGTASIVINIENFSWMNRGTGWKNAEGALLQGVISRPYLLQAQQKTRSFGVILKPEAVNRLLGLPLRELADNDADLEGALGFAAKVWAEQIRNAVGDEERAKLTDAFLLHRLQHRAITHPYLENALALIRQSAGNLDVEQLSLQLFVSQRQLERQFREHIGLTPKMMLRIERFRNALHLAKSGFRRGGLTDIAHNCGYADQAHFIRECRELTGETPSQLFDRPEALVAPVLT